MTEVTVVGGMTMNGWMDGILHAPYKTSLCCASLVFEYRKSNLFSVSTTYSTLYSRW